MFAETSLDFIEKLSPSEKADYGDDRVADMTGKPQFSDMASHGIVLADLTTAGSNLRAGILAAAGGTKAQKDALTSLIKAWDKVARRVAKYVTEKAQEQVLLDDQIAVINVSGFKYNKVTKSSIAAPDQVKNFKMTPVVGSPGITKIKSDAVAPNVTYVSVFNKNAALLDSVTVVNNQITIPVGSEPFIIHTTTDSREEDVILSSGEKWYGNRFALNKNGRGPASDKTSVIPQ